MLVSSKVSIVIPIRDSSVMLSLEVGVVDGLSGKEAKATEIELESV